MNHAVNILPLARLEPTTMTTPPSTTPDIEMYSLGHSIITYLRKRVFSLAFGFSNIAFTVLFLRTLLLCHILLFGC